MERGELSGRTATAIMGSPVRTGPFNTQYSGSLSDMTSLEQYSDMLCFQLG